MQEAVAAGLYGCLSFFIGIFFFSFRPFPSPNNQSPTIANNHGGQGDSS
jgi:hypothetical protein